MTQYGVRTKSGEVVTDNHWTDMGAVMSGMNGFGWTQGSEFGVLVIWNGEEWEEVQHD